MKPIFDRNMLRLSMPFALFSSAAHLGLERQAEQACPNETRARVPVLWSLVCIMEFVLVRVP